MSTSDDTAASDRDGKTLQLFLTKLTEAEKLEEELKSKLSAAENEIKKSENLLSKVTDQVKTVDDKIKVLYSQLPTVVTKTLVIESENKILCHQIESFESKIAEIRQQISQTQDKQDREINEFVEQSFSFVKNYGLNGHIRCQTQVLQKTVEKLRTRRNQLKDEIKSLNSSDSKSVLTESQTLADRLKHLNQKKASLTPQNYEMKCIQTNLKTRLEEIKIKIKNGKEIKDLQQQLDDLQNKSKKLMSIEPIVSSNDVKSFESAAQVLKKKQNRSVGFKDEPQIIEISDDSLNDSIEDISDLSPKKTTTGQSGQHSQSPKEMSPNFTEQKKQIQNEVNPKTVQQIWELKRKRRRVSEQ